MGGATRGEARPPIEALTPALVPRVRLPLCSRFSSRALAEHVRRYPGMAFLTDEGRQYIVAGPWRRRADIAELMEVSHGPWRPELLREVAASLTHLGVKLLLIDFAFGAVDRELCAEAGFGFIERVIELERRSGRVEPVDHPGLQRRRYTPADRDALLELERESFPWLWWNSPEEWESYVATPGVEVIVGLEQGRLVGYAGLTARRGDGYLDRLAVRESDQGRGFGRALLVEALGRLERAGARQVRLTTQEHNVRSQALYARYGFRRSQWAYDIYGKWLGQLEDSQS